jgi:hypothetical protein
MSAGDGIGSRHGWECQSANPDQPRSKQEVLKVRLDVTRTAQSNGSSTVARSRRDGTGDNDQGRTAVAAKCSFSVQRDPDLKPRRGLSAPGIGCSSRTRTPSMSMSHDSIGLKAHLRDRRPRCASGRRSAPGVSGRERPCGRDTSATRARPAGALPVPARARRRECPAQGPPSSASSAFGRRVCALTPVRDLTPGRKPGHGTARDGFDGLKAAGQEREHRRASSPAQERQSRWGPAREQLYMEKRGPRAHAAQPEPRERSR